MENQYQSGSPGIYSCKLNVGWIKARSAGSTMLQLVDPALRALIHPTTAIEYSR